MGHNKLVGEQALSTVLRGVKADQDRQDEDIRTAASTPPEALDDLDIEHLWDNVFNN